MTNPWDEIFFDNFDTAYKIADKNYLETASDVDLRARATCSFLLGKYANALEDFLALNDLENEVARTSDDTYMRIALCYYAMEKFDEAIDFFKFPVVSRKEIKYTVDQKKPGCILYYIATKLNRSDILKIAQKELHRLERYKLAVPLYLLGELSEIELNYEYERYPNGPYRIRQQCQIEFYKGVSQLQNGRTDKYREHLKRCVNVKGLYLEFEFYIAKVELDRYNSTAASFGLY